LTQNYAFYSNGDVKKMNAEWKANLKLPPKDNRFRTKVSILIYIPNSLCKLIAILFLFEILK
jgi:hypothetical protein